MSETNIMVIKKLKILARQVLPAFAIIAIEKIIANLKVREFNKNSDLKFAEKSPKEVFTYIYKQKLWGKDTVEDFYSGSGSHDELTLSLYVSAIQDFISKLAYVPNVVDLGCGDFNVGRQLRNLCNTYIACDVVGELIDRNKDLFAGMDVDFLCLDMCDAPLPSGDIVFIRQVFQHLNNQQILSVVKKLTAYKHVIITEGLPIKRNFVPNIDKPIGDGIRFQRKISSGVVLSLPPFSLPHKSETILCEMPCGDAVIRTTAYEIQ